MSDLPQISEAEFEVMKIVWKHAPISTNEITDKLLQTTNWSPKTIQTLIKRLVTKGALTYEKQSRVFVYTPVVKENEYIGQESNSFLERYYDGDITAMLSAYIENDRLSETEIDTLRSLLSKRSKKEAINVANFMIRFSYAMCLSAVSLESFCLSNGYSKTACPAGCSIICGFCCSDF